MAGDTPTSVILIDDHELIRQGLRRAFERGGEFTVVAEAGSLAEARKEIVQSPPQVVIVDIRLPDGSGLDLVKELRGNNPALGIVVLSMYSGDEYLFGALDNGASAFVSKDAPAEDVMAAARHAVAMPGSFSAPNLAEAMRVLGLVQRFGSDFSIAQQVLRQNGNPDLTWKVDAGFVSVTLRPVAA
jgi:DNA-binding NarL/FixJ family response regulator